MGFSSGKSSSSQVVDTATQNDIPDWLKAAYQDNLHDAQDIADNPFQAYGAPLTASDNSYLSAAREQALNAAQTGKDNLAGAAKIFGEVADQSPYPTKTQQFAGTDLSAYMSPYQQSVIDQSNAELRRQGDITQAQNQAAATGAGAYGGSRHGIVDAENNRNVGQAIANNTNGLLQSGFNWATTQANADVDRRINANQFNSDLDMRNTGLNLQGAQGLLGVAAAKQGQAMNGAQALEAAGLNLQGQEQAGLDARYGEFLRQQDFPYQQQQLLNSTVFGIPYGAVSSSTGSQNSSGKGASQQVKASYGGK